MGGQRHNPAALPPGKRADIHCTGGWVDLRVGLDALGFVTQSRPSRRESLYRLRYPGPVIAVGHGDNDITLSMLPTIRVKF